MSVSPDTAAVHNQVQQAVLTTRTDRLIREDISSMLFDTKTHRIYIETTETSRGTIKIRNRYRFCVLNKAKTTTNKKKPTTTILARRQMRLWSISTRRSGGRTHGFELQSFVSSFPKKKIKSSLLHRGKDYFTLDGLCSSWGEASKPAAVHVSHWAASRTSWGCRETRVVFSGQIMSVPIPGNLIRKR